MLKVFNVDDTSLLNILSNTLRCRADIYCAYPICSELMRASLHSGESCVVWQKDKKPWSIINTLLIRPKAGTPSVLLFKCNNNISMLMERGSL